MRPTYLIFLLLLGNILQAQTLVFGKITDAESNEPLPYVNIGIPGASIGTVSDEQGYYLIEIPPDKIIDSLYFSMVALPFKALKLIKLKEQTRSCSTLHLIQKLLL